MTFFAVQVQVCLASVQWSTHQSDCHGGTVLSPSWREGGRGPESPHSARVTPHTPQVTFTRFLPRAGSTPSFCWTLQPPRTALGQCPGTCLSGALKLDLVAMSDRLYWLLLSSQDLDVFSLKPIAPCLSIQTCLPPSYRATTDMWSPAWYLHHLNSCYCSLQWPNTS